MSPVLAAPIALCCPETHSAAWQESLRAALPGARMSVWPAVAAGARYAIVWSPTQDFLDAHPDLHVIFNMGAGVDALLRLRLPANARLVRVEDGGMAVQMADYVCHALLRHFREFDAYAASAEAHDWKPRPLRNRREFPVGVMGLGALGRRVAMSVAAFEFPTFGWSLSPKRIDGVTCFDGEAAFDEFLSKTRVLVCMLPLTPATRGILNRASLSRLQPGAYLINAARGDHLVEQDLLALLDSGHLAGATLDVTRQEPLPADHPFWKHPKIVLTPHIAAQTVVEEAIAQIAANLNALQGEAGLEGLVDLRRGY